MKKAIFFGLAIMALMLAFSTDTYAQKKKKSSKNDQYFNESGGFAHRLWYGGGLTLGFGSDNFQSVFQFGVSPMVGYKIIDRWSVGPRMSIIYSNLRYRPFDQVYTANPISWGAGVFTRFKALDFLFAHVEYEYEREAYITGQIDSNNDLEVFHRQRNNMYLGLGYSSSSPGSPWGFELLLLYNVNTPKDVLELPFDIRAGVTYNF